MNYNDFRKNDDRNGPLKVDNCLAFASIDRLWLIYLSGHHELGFLADVTNVKPVLVLVAVVVFVCAVQCVGNVDAEYDVEPLELRQIEHDDVAPTVHVIMAQSLMVATEWLLDCHLAFPIRFWLAFELHSEEDPLLLWRYFEQQKRKKRFR